MFSLNLLYWDVNGETRRHTAIILKNKKQTLENCQVFCDAHSTEETVVPISSPLPWQQLLL